MTHTGGSIRFMAEAMGLETETIARTLRVNPRTVGRWLSEAKPIPEDVVEQVLAWQHATTTEVRRITAEITTAAEQTGQAAVTLTRYADRALLPHPSTPEQMWLHSVRAYDHFLARIMYAALDRGLSVHVVTASTAAPRVFTIGAH